MITVVKLGGSLLAAETLSACLHRVVQMPGQVLVVAGGGVFADLVREQQLPGGYDDLAAHRMAILAMQQMALLMHSLQPQLSLCRHLEDFGQANDKALWLPDWWQLEQAGIAASWDITSDSLAAWLAGQLQAERLWLVKAGAVEANALWRECQQQGLLDLAFAEFAEPLACRIEVIHQQRFLCNS